MSALVIAIVVLAVTCLVLGSIAVLAHVRDARTPHLHVPTTPARTVFEHDPRLAGAVFATCAHRDGRECTDCK